jgi:hypothetical protein
MLTPVIMAGITEARRWCMGLDRHTVLCDWFHSGYTLPLQLHSIQLTSSTELRGQLAHNGHLCSCIHSEHPPQPG